MTSKMQIGQEYRQQVMYLLTRLGYATTRQVAMGLFGGCETHDCKQASRTIRWLLNKGYVVEKRSYDNSTGERMIALTRRGVSALSDERELPAGKHHARDWLRHAHSHRTACNSIWMALYRGLVEPGWSELEIRNGLAPRHLSLFGYQTTEGQQLHKIPDLLIEYVGDERQEKPIWVEVENAWRGAKDFEKLIHFLRAIFNTSAPPVSQVWFVVTAVGARSISRRLRTALSHGPESGYSILVKRLDERILNCHIRFFHLESNSLSLLRCPR